MNPIDLQTANRNSILKIISRIDNIINENYQNNIVTSIMLTGGNSAERLYKIWSQSNNSMMQENNIRYFLGDERCVPTNSYKSNHYMIMNNFFKHRIDAFNFQSIYHEGYDIDYLAEEYEKKIQNKIDVLLLSVGDDGHIASIFPFSPAIYEAEKLMIAVRGPESEFMRLTITPKVFVRARNIFVMAFGDKKRKVYEDAIKNPLDFNTLPARMVLNGDWFF
jgi:6-phosphogluconolactonase